MTDESIETGSVTKIQDVEDPVLASTVNLAIEMIRIKFITNQQTLTDFCEHVYPALKQLQSPKAKG